MTRCDPPRLLKQRTRAYSDATTEETGNSNLVVLHGGGAALESYFIIQAADLTK